MQTVTIRFCLLIIQVMVHKRTIPRFIADDNAVYQRVRWTTQMASDNNWARRRLKHLSWRSRWIILCILDGKCQFHTKSHEMIGAFLLVLLTEHDIHSLPLHAERAVCRCLVAGQLYPS